MTGGGRPPLQQKQDRWKAGPSPNVEPLRLSVSPRCPRGKISSAQQHTTGGSRPPLQQKQDRWKAGPSPKNVEPLPLSVTSPGQNPPHHSSTVQVDVGLRYSSTIQAEAGPSPNAENVQATPQCPRCKSFFPRRRKRGSPAPHFPRSVRRMSKSTGSTL